VRFPNETYGPLAGKNLVELIGLGLDLPESMVTLTGLSLGEFESTFKLWLVGWEGPVREPVARYLIALGPILAAETANSQQRTANLGASTAANESISSRATLVHSTEELVDTLQALTPPEQALFIHQEAQRPPWARSSLAFPGVGGGRRPKQHASDGRELHDPRVRSPGFHTET
jgi:hypothetical protein|tara:strand:- start:446 stop:967 length:522 start_codon:yes stop_codon:yes gene_type:complete